MRKIIILLFGVLCLSISTRGQTGIDDPIVTELIQSKSAQALLYWFDENADNKQTINNLSGNYAIDVSSLAGGLHVLHYGVLDNSGIISGPTSRLFLKANEISAPFTTGSLTGATLLYWFDEDTGSKQTTSSLSGTYILDVSVLADGLHTLHYLIRGADGTAYSTYSSVFIKMVKMEEALSEVADIITTVPAKGIAYWFDEDETSKKVCDDLSGTYAVDVSSLADGLHVIHYYVVGENNLPYGLTSTMFLKNEEQFGQHEPNGIIKYLYRLNNDNSTARTVTLDQPANPYTLMTLLPVQQMPIRSSSFHFQVNDGQPTIYAKNDIRIRFFDARGYFVDEEKSYIDYSVSQNLVTITQLEATQTFPRMGENVIRWYAVSLERGDSVEFKTDRTCSMQLFSPSGEEVYKSEGAETVSWGGCHAQENGTYYLSLHDVTSKNGDSIRLDYNHIDKYAVLRHDVSFVGNGGCSTITIEGNGFNDLYSVDLYNEHGDTIHHVLIGHESDATSSLVFDFTDAVLGQYNALFHFTLEDRTITNFITVEEAKPLDIKTTLAYPASFMLGNPVKIVIKVHNSGNGTAYGVPVFIDLRTDSEEAITRIIIKGIDLPSLFELASTVEMTDTEFKKLEEMSKEIGDTHYFIPSEDLLSMLGYFLVNVPPYSEIEIELEVTTRETIHAAVSVPPQVSEVYCLPSIVGKIEPVRFHKRSFKEGFCCYHERIECVASTISSIADALSPGLGFPADVISCISSSVSTITSTSASLICDTDKSIPDKVFSSDGARNGYSILSTIMTCVKTFSPFKKAEKIKELIKNINDWLRYPNAGLAGWSCGTALMKNTDCPLFTSVQGASVPVASRDPNDIYGYSAESGCQAIKDRMTDVFYAIEFENDTTFATAPAHNIYLTDTLDYTKFDLSTFRPTRIKIGNKTAELSGEKNFVTTIDMRPDIYAIAQVEGAFDVTKGIARWHISSLDPMTMEPTEELSAGVLPINTDGSGMGEVSFDISLQDGLLDGTEINNRASIVFDSNEPILTPTWTNIIDAVAPTSTILGAIQSTDSTLTLRLAGEDERSGVWKYSVYSQMGEGSTWELVAENVTDTLCDVRVFEGMEYGFLVLATDSAGNVENKAFEAEFTLSTFLPGDANGDGVVNSTDAQLVVNYYLGKEVYLNFAAADVVTDGQLNSVDAQAIQNIYLNSTQNRVLLPRRARPRKVTSQ